MKLEVKINSSGTAAKTEDGMYKYTYSFELEYWGKVYLWRKFKTLDEAKEYASTILELANGLKSPEQYYIRRDFQTGEHYLQLRVAAKKEEQLKLFD